MFKWEITLITRKAKRLLIHIEAYSQEEKEDTTPIFTVQYSELIKVVKKKVRNLLNVIIPIVSQTFLP